MSTTGTTHSPTRRTRMMTENHGGGVGETRGGAKNGEAKGKTTLDEWDAVCTF